MTLLPGLFSAAPLLAGGTPDPGTDQLREDDELGADGDSLPDNENQLMGILGANRGFGFGDYVSDSGSGLQSTIGNNAHYQFFIEVPPGQTTLTIEIFDADTGAGDVGAGTEEHDQNDNTPYDTTTQFDLLDPSGGPFATITLGPQDCDPVTPGQQTGCNNAWSDLGTFTVNNPVPGHWQFTVFAEDLGGNQDDNNSFGIRAHDGDATASGTEFNVYANTYVGVGQVFGSSIPPFPDLSRTHDFFPMIRGFCSCDANDWDTDANGDEETTYTPPRPPAGTPTSFSPTPASINGNWGQEVISGFTTDTDANNYGLWNLRWITGGFNFITFYMADESAADPALPPSSAGNGASPDLQPEVGAIRLYLPADGSRFFGQRGGADDVVIAPDKPWVGHSWALVAGEPDLALGVTSRIEVTITVDNPTDLPIQFDAVTTDPDVLTAHVPTNGGQTAYVTGSATITGGSSTATAESGAGPWDLTFAPGVVAANSTATLTYRIDVTPSALGTLDVTGAGVGNGTQGSYLDETCANGAGGASVCPNDVASFATFNFGPLCELAAPVTGSIGAAKRVSSGPVDNMDGTFTVGFELLLENLGTDPLTMVQVTDDLAVTFPAPAVVTTVSAVVVNNAGGGMLTANGSYNGVGDINLLDAATSSLPVGTTSTITFTVTFDPNGLPGPFFNQAFASGDTPGGTVTDPSDNGNDPDPNGNGNANEAGENDPTPIVVPENPSISVTKSAGVVTDAPTAGQFDVTYSIVTTNDGNVDLTMVQVTDDLSLTFPAPVTVISANALCTAGSCGTVTVDYTGAADTTLLDASASSLVVGASFTLELTVRFDPNAAPGPFNNSATSSGRSPLGTDVQDTDTASTAVPENPSISVVKTAGAVTDAPTVGQFDVVYTIVTTNDGNVDLDTVQVTDDLSLTFPAPATVISASALCTAGSCGTVTVDYTGAADTTLLDASASSLVVGATFTLELTVRFDPNAASGPFNNQATSSGESPLDTAVQDDDSAATAVPENPSIAVTKTAGMVNDAGGGLFDVTYTIVATNDGNVDLDTLQLADDLSLTFPAPASVTAASAMCTAGSCGTVTVDFTGPADTTLLDASASSLVVGAGVTIELSVTFDPNGNAGPFTNLVDASADSPLGTSVQDDDTADISIGENPSVTITKTAGAVTDAPTAGQFDVTFTLVATNTGDVDLSNFQIFDPLDIPFSPANVISSSVLCTAGSCGTVTIDYGGPVDFTLLDAALSTLPVGLSVTFELSARFQPGEASGPFTNAADVSGDSPLGTNVTDSDTADVVVPGNPSIDVVKNLTNLVDNMDGTFVATFGIDVTNTGNVDLLGVQIVDDLSLTFPAPVTIVTVTPAATGAWLTANPGYDGVVDTNLLAGPPNTLPAGEADSFQFMVTFEQNSATGPFTNQADGSGTSPQGTDVQDSDTADVTVPPPVGMPIIGIAKAVTAGPVDNMDGTYTVSILLTVDNLGDVDLTDVQVTDDLSLTFPLPAGVTSVTAPVTMITAGVGTLDANAAYDGVGDVNLLVSATSTLDVGASGEITFDITFDPADETSFFNTAIATADSSSGMTSDTSDDGTETDTDGDGNPDEDGENDPTPIDVDVDVLAIPTLGTWGLFSMAAILALLGAGIVRRRV